MMNVAVVVRPLCDACQRARAEQGNKKLLVPYAYYRCKDKNGIDNLFPIHYRIYKEVREWSHIICAQLIVIKKR